MFRSKQVHVADKQPRSPMRLFNKYKFKKAGFVLLFLGFGLFASPVFAVSWVISEPNVGGSSGVNGHTQSGPVSYIITYTETSPTLVLYDDPGFFELHDATHTPVDSQIYIRAIDEFSREIKIEEIGVNEDPPSEGVYHLHFDPGTAEDGDGQAIGGQGNPFTSDKTSPVGEISGPFEVDLVTDITSLEAGDDAYYTLDYSVDDLVEPERSRVEADLFPIAPIEGSWEPINEDFFAFQNTEFSGVVEYFRSGAVITIRVSNINGPETDFGIRTQVGAALDYANNLSPEYISDLVIFDDDIGPELTIKAPVPTITNGEPVVYEVVYTGADSVTLSPSDITVHTTGDASADLSVNVLGSTAEVEFTNFSGEGQLWFEIAAGTASDASGDLAPAAGPSASVEVDLYGPVVVFTDPSPLNTASGPVSFFFSFSDAISVSLVRTEVVVNTTGTVAYTQTELNSTGANSREFRVSGLSGEGTLSISIPGGVAIDQYLQPSIASDESPAVTVGPLPPMSIAISEPSVSHTVSGPVSYVVSYAGVAFISLNSGNINIQSAGTAVANTVEVTGSGATRTVTLSDVSGQGAIAIVIDPGTAEDPEGSLIDGITGNPFGVGSDDIDGDLVPDGQEEFVDFTDKNDPDDYLDTDKDIVPDFVEQILDATDAFDDMSFKDSDGGYSPDYAELYQFPSTTNIYDESDDQQDFDGDGLPDYLELVLRVDGAPYDEGSLNSPVVDGNLDTDVDGVSDAQEFYLSGLLTNADPGFYDDFDRDGYLDHHELGAGLDPLFAKPDKDDDNDGIPNRVEAAAGADIGPADDLDVDGIPDYIEWVFDRSRVNAGDSAAIYISNFIDGNPLIDGASDTDADGLGDLDELAQGYNPFYADQPVIWLRFLQNGKRVCHIDNSVDTPVDIVVMTGNTQAHLETADWSASDLEVLSAASVGFDSLQLDSQDLDVGTYEIVVSVERMHNAISLVSEYKQLLVVKADSDNLDEDEDGICDSDDNELAPVSARSEINAGASNAASDYKNFLHLGYLLALDDQADSVVIPYALIESNGQDVAPTETDLVDSGFGNLMPRHHALIQNLEEAGASTSYTFAYTGASLPSGSVFRVLSSGGWQSFDTSVDTLESSTQACASASFQSGLLESALCIRLGITDGGANDLDGLVNGSVSLLGAPALAGAPSVDDPDAPAEIDEEDEEENPFADFVPGQRQIEIGEAGSFGSPVLLLLLSLLAGLRKAGIKVNVSVTANRKKKIALHKFHTVVFLAFFLLPVSSHAAFEEVGSYKDDNQEPLRFKTWLKKLPLPPADKLYVGAATGQSGLDGEFSNLYEVNEDSDLGFKLWLDYQLREQWFLEFEWARLGSSEVQASPGALGSNVFPAQFSESIDYQHGNVAALYQYPLAVEKLSVFAKGGLAYADVKSNLDVEVLDRFSPSFGAGVQYQFKPKFFARLEYETFSADSSLLSVGLLMRIAEPKEPAPEPVAEPEPAPEPEAEEEELVEPEQEAEPVPDPLEALEQLAAESAEPEVDMEQLYAELKRDIEPSSIFEKGSAALSTRVMGNLDMVVYFLDSYPDVQLVITGHASDEGHEYLNENLSHLRAHGAKTYLQANGIDEERITVRARGEHFPAYTEADEDFRIRNRRIEYDFYIPVKKQ